MNRRSWLVVSVIADAVFINLAIIAAFLLRFSGSLPTFNFRAYSNLAVAITVVQLIALYIYDLYNVEEMKSSWDVFFAIVKATTLGIILVVSLSYFVQTFSFPRLVFVMSWITLTTFLAGWRMVAGRVLKVAWPKQNVLIVGAGEAAKEIVEELSGRTQWGYQVVGVLNREPEHVGRPFGGTTVIGTIDELAPIVHEKQVDRVIVASPTRHRELIEEMAKSDDLHVKVEVIPDLYEIFIGTVDHTLISDIPLVELTKEPTPNWVAVAKRLTDLTAAVALAVILSPLLLICAVAIRLTSKGKAVYRQERVGQSERLFSIYKFRTMSEDAEEATGPVLAGANDGRVTPLGRFLRRYRIDEVPQLVNIIKGEMSFVGPRPERPFFVEEFKKTVPGYHERFRVKPGVTGLAQISGSYATTPRNKLKYDLIYIYNGSPFLDLRILLKTLKVGLTGKGAQ